MPDLRPAALAWATLAGCLTALVSSLPEYFQLARELSGLRSGALLLTVTFPAVVVWAARSCSAEPYPRAARARGSRVARPPAWRRSRTIGAHTRYAVVIGALGLAGGRPGPRRRCGRPPCRVRAGRGLARGRVRRAPRWASAIGGAAFQFAQSDKRAAGSSFEEALRGGVGWAALGAVRCCSPGRRRC